MATLDDETGRPGVFHQSDNWVRKIGQWVYCGQEIANTLLAVVRSYIQGSYYLLAALGVRDMMVSKIIRAYQ